MLLDPAKNLLRVVVSKGMSKNLIKKESKEPRKSISAWVLENKKAVLVKNVNEDERFQASEYASQYKTNSFMIAPLLVSGEIVGTINANDKAMGASFTEEDLVFLKTFSHQVSLTLQYLQLISELEREKKQLGLLVDLEKILLEARDPNLMLRQIIKKCQEMLDASIATIYLKDEFTNELVYRVGWDGDKEIKMKHRIQLNQSATGKVAGEGKSIIINRPEQVDFFSKEVEWAKDAEIKNYIASPIWVGDKVIGVIRVLNRRDGAFRKPDLALLEGVARSVGIALRNLELYLKLERSIEETIQVNQMLSRANQELQMKTRELEALRRNK
jgi:GAF domain-containing protein